MYVKLYFTAYYVVLVLFYIQLKNVLFVATSSWETSWVFDGTDNSHHAMKDL